jgi:hypothetical protein
MFFRLIAASRASRPRNEGARTMSPRPVIAALLASVASFAWSSATPLGKAGGGEIHRPGRRGVRRGSGPGAGHPAQRGGLSPPYRSASGRWPEPLRPERARRVARRRPAAWQPGERRRVGGVLFRPGGDAGRFTRCGAGTGRRAARRPAPDWIRQWPDPIFVGPVIADPFEPVRRQGDDAGAVYRRTIDNPGGDRAGAFPGRPSREPLLRLEAHDAGALEAQIKERSCVESA